MKKAVLPLLLLCLTQGVKAQDAGKTAQDYNKWTVELGGGINKVSNPLTPGYHVDAFNFYSVNAGARYMFNTKFGIKATGSLDRLQGSDISEDFETQFFSVGLQGVVNLGRVLEFETWTKRLNVLGHAGVGVGFLSGDMIKETDHTGNFLIGFTGQLKVSKRVTLWGDFNMTNTYTQHRTWNGAPYDGSQQGFDGTLYAATVGLNIALGKHEEHADWFVYNDEDKINDLESRLGELETMMNDSDKDGVPDYLDAEPNTINGVAVDSKGRTIDRNENGVADELESYIEERDRKNKESMGADLQDMINGGYVNVYFDFNQDMPNASSIGGINFLIKYLKENPGKSADVIGYADEIGDTEYNKALSARRADNVKKILTDAGIDAGRLNIVSNGEDNSVNKDSQWARQTVRRVTFIIK
ncbi:OmpA family protein [Flavobacterium sp. RHBU_24]|uniref:OmpA family protein n=1 Tax=Flavobacterium sp. RHBU_24 TaxID=3391185 RepID=UPI003984AE67